MKLINMPICKKQHSRQTAVSSFKPQLNAPSQLAISSFSQTKLKNSSQPSFKSLNSILYKQSKKVANPKEIMQLFTKYMGPSVEKFSSELTDSSTEMGKLLKGRILQENGEIFFKEKTVISSFIDSALFPIKEMPFMITDSLLSVGKKIPFLKDAAENAYNGKFVSNMRNKAMAEEKLNVLQGFYEKVEEIIVKRVSKNADGDISADELASKVRDELNDLLKKQDLDKDLQESLLARVTKKFGAKSGNYSTAHERPLNRIVSGLIPAAFLANDAYNLSVLCKDKKEDSENEHNARFKQEVARVLTNAYLQLITLGAFTSFVNKRAANSALITATTVLVSETTSRLANGKAPYFISPKKAKEKNRQKAEKEGKVYSGTQNNSPVNSGKPAVVNNPVKNDVSALNKKLDNKKQENNKSDKSTVISFDALKKLAGGLLVGGITISYLLNSRRINKFDDADKAISGIRKVYDDFTESIQKKIYKPLTEKEFTVNEKELEEALSRLQDANPQLGKIYSDIKNGFKTKVVDDKLLFEGKKVKTKSKPFIDALTRPFTFAFGVLRLPFKLVKTASSSILEGVATSMEKNNRDATKIRGLLRDFFGAAKVKSDNPEKIFMGSINKIIKKSNAVRDGKISPEEFNKFINNSLVEPFNVKTQSNYSNTNLAMLTKLVASTITSYFLVADNYNMVMLKSDGEDKEGAMQKAQERVVQRASGMFYQTMFMNIFNTVFESLYHMSLGGMSLVVTMNTLCTEFFTRVSIGMPIKSKSYDELIAYEEKNNNRPGLAGKYFRFMSKLTGKKSLSNRAYDKNTKFTATNVVMDTDKEVKQKTTSLLEIYTKK